MLRMLMTTVSWWRCWNWTNCFWDTTLGVCLHGIILSVGRDLSIFLLLFMSVVNKLHSCVCIYWPFTAPHKMALDMGASDSFDNSCNFVSHHCYQAMCLAVSGLCFSKTFERDGVDSETETSISFWPRMPWRHPVPLKTTSMHVPALMLTCMSCFLHAHPKTKLVSLEIRQMQISKLHERFGGLCSPDSVGLSIMSDL